MTDPSTAVANRCYRHPDRESFVRCQRCGRTICGECQTLAAVGVHCPECVREARASAPRVKSQARMAFSRNSSAPIVTYGLVGVSVVLSLLTLVPGVSRTLLAYTAVSPQTVQSIPWTVLTHVLVNYGGIINIALGGLVMFWFGRMLESALGRLRFAAFAGLTAIGSAAFVVVLGGGFSAGTIGLTTGFLLGTFIFLRNLGTSWYLLVFVAANIGFSIYVGSGWQAIVGGAATAALVSLIMIRTRRISRARLQVALLAGLGVLLLLVCYSLPGAIDLSGLTS